MTSLGGNTIGSDIKIIEKRKHKNTDALSLSRFIKYKGHWVKKTIRRVAIWLVLRPEAGLIVPVEVISSSYGTGHPWAHTCSEIAIAPVRVDAARAGEPLDLYLTRTEARSSHWAWRWLWTWYCLEPEGIRTSLVRVWDKYTARATGCMETSTLARHGRSVWERSLQIARNKSFRLAGRGVQWQRLRSSSIRNFSNRKLLEDTVCTAREDGRACRYVGLILRA